MWESFSSKQKFNTQVVEKLYGIQRATWSLVLLTKILSYPVYQLEFAERDKLTTNIYFVSQMSSYVWSHGVMVSTLDFESSDPSSNLGGTSEECSHPTFFSFFFF